MDNTAPKPISHTINPLRNSGNIQEDATDTFLYEHVLAYSFECAR